VVLTNRCSQWTRWNTYPRAAKVRVS